MTTRLRRGWLGGTFDPIHQGHLDVARAAHHALGLSPVTLVPARTPPHRNAPHAPAADRLAMVRLAADEPWLDVSTIEIDFEGPSFTAVTLDRLSDAGHDLTGMVLITGADAFAGITAWHRGAEILDRVTVAVISRPGYPASALRAASGGLAARMIAPEEADTAARPSIILIDAPTAAVSSTEVRRRAARGESLKGLVPDAVGTYIANHGLYKGNS